MRFEIRGANREIGAPSKFAKLYFSQKDSKLSQAGRISDVQCEHLVALAGTELRQYGQSRIAGAGAAGAGFGAKRLTWRTRRKTATATIRKLMTVFKKRP